MKPLARIFVLLALGITPGMTIGCTEIKTVPTGIGDVAGDGGVQIDGAPIAVDASDLVDGNLDSASSKIDAATLDGASASDGASNACGVCNQPPSGCYALTGHCESDHCVYDPIDGASCDDGDSCTLDDTCSQGACIGTPKVCDQSPAAVCLSGTQLRTYDTQGVCTGGLCVYGKQSVTCGTGGCANGACQTDPCAGVTCNSPPSSCFGSQGVCAGGSCTYPYANGTSCNDQNSCTTGDQCVSGACIGTPKSCNAPPTNVCDDASTLRVYSASGSCSAATCSYSYGFVNCANGCVSGACKASGWLLMSSNTTLNLQTIWGSSASAIWAGGPTTLVYYNGAQWQVRTLGTGLGSGIWRVTGTSATNVYALSSINLLLHYNGTSWSQVADFSSRGTPIDLYVSPSAPNDVYVVGSRYSNNYYAFFSKVSGGTITDLISSSAQFANCNPTRMIGFGADDLWIESPTCGVFRYQSGALAYVGASKTAPNGSDLFGESAQGVMAMNGWAVDLWDGSIWNPLTLGSNSFFTTVTGTASNRMFLMGINPDVLLYYDGVGFTQQTLPSGYAPYSIPGAWAASTGEVFFVGEYGTILKGP